MEEHRALASKGAELVELRVDYMRKKPDIGLLLKERPTPVVVTCRRRSDRGRWFGTEEQRLSILREAIIAGAEYVDLDRYVDERSGRIIPGGKRHLGRAGERVADSTNR